MAQTWGARLRVSVDDVVTGDELLALRHTFPSIRHLLGPTSVYLKPGETWYPLDIPGALLSQTTVSAVTRPRAVALLVTDTPGVKYLLSNAPAPAGALTPGRILLSGTETIRTANFGTTPPPTPVYSGGGNWLNSTSGPGNDNTQPIYSPSLRTKVAEDQLIHIGNKTGWMDERQDVAGGLARGGSRFVYGRENKINLGGPDDGLEFDFWAKMGITQELGTTYLKFGSYPYVATTNELDLADTDGDENDSTYLLQPLVPPSGGQAPGDIGAYWYVELLSYNASFSVPNVWHHYRFRKQDFTARQFGGVDPDWSRITWIEFWSASTTGGFYRSPLYLTAAAASFRRLDIAALEILHWNDLVEGYPEVRDRDRATLCLFGPPSHGANVKVFWGIP